MNETEFADLNSFSNFHSLYFQVGHLLMLSNFWKKYNRKGFTSCKLKGFYGSGEIQKRKIANSVTFGQFSHKNE